MTTQLPYTCRFCGKTRVVSYDDSFVQDIGRWVRMLSCDRCADFLATRNRLTRSIGSTCRTLHIARMAPHGLSKTARDEGWEKLEVLTKALAACVCDYLRLTHVWEPDFVAQLIDHPDKCETIVRLYMDGLRRIRTGGGK